MKKLVLGSLTFFLFLTGTAEISYGADLDPQQDVNFEYEETTLPKEETKLTPEFLEIKIQKKGVTYTFAREPKAEDIEKTLNAEPKNYSKFGPIVPEYVDVLAQYKSLNEQEKMMFEEARAIYLSKTAALMHFSRFAIGTGLIVGDSFQFLYSKIRGKEVSVFEKGARDRLIQNILQKLDHRLFSQARFVAYSNEFGLVGSVGLQAVGGLRKKGFGGNFETGIYLAYNFKKKSFVIENYVGTDLYRESMGAVGSLGISFKGGAFMAGREFGKEAINRSGHNFYPPLVPTYITTAEKQIGAGGSYAIALPPSPFADMMTFTSKFNQLVTLRVEMSTLFKGFVRVQSGDYLGSAKSVGSSIQEYIELVRVGFAHLRGKTCGKAFAGL